MNFGRADYQSIQPWPTHRPHLVFDDAGNLIEVKGTHDRGIDAAVAEGRVRPIIPDDEPVFLIRGQDIVGPDALAAYAGLAEAAGADPRLVDAVLGHADLMRRYQAERAAKTPDLAATVPQWPAVSRTDDPGRDT